MAILHKNISAEGDIHNPKWFSGANNGDVAWKNELGVLESTDELVLPAALNFVDGSVSPPTSNSGDIYVLSSGASVNAGWGTVALGDWVRYDGTTWNVITPQKSTLCYNETLDKLFSYSGSTWAEVGGGGGTDVNAVHVNAPSEISGITAKATPTASDLLIIEDVADGNNKKKITIGDLPSSGGGASIYTASDTIGSGRVATLTDTLRFKDGTFEIQGIGTTGSSALAIYDGQGTPVKLWDFLDNGNVNLGVDSVVDLGNTNNLTIENSGASSNFQINSSGNGYFLFNRSGGLKVRPGTLGNDPIVVTNTVGTFDTFTVKKNGGGSWSAYNGVKIGELTTNDFAQFTIDDLNFYKANVLQHKIGFGVNTSDIDFWINGVSANNSFRVGGSNLIDLESISLKGKTIIQGEGTGTGVALGVYNKASTPVKVFEVLDNSTIKTNGNVGFTGTGNYTTFTIENGIITSAS